MEELKNVITKYGIEDGKLNELGVMVITFFVIALLKSLEGKNEERSSNCR